MDEPQVAGLKPPTCPQQRLDIPCPHGVTPLEQPVRQVEASFRITKLAKTRKWHDSGSRGVSQRCVGDGGEGLDVELFTTR